MTLACQRSGVPNQGWTLRPKRQFETGQQLQGTTLAQLWGGGWAATQPVAETLRRHACDRPQGGVVQARRAAAAHELPMPGVVPRDDTHRSLEQPSRRILQRDGAGGVGDSPDRNRPAPQAVTDRLVDVGG